MNEQNKKVHPQPDLSNQEIINAMTDDQGNIVDGDLLVKLLKRYLPLIKSLAGKYYIRGMEFEDWKQESALVMIKIIKNYNTKLRIPFGAYYRRCLRNHVYDFIRKETAKKRIPNNCVTSYSANRSYYDDIFKDIRATHPEQSLIITDIFKRLLEIGSSFEDKVIIGQIFQQSFEEIAENNHCSVVKVKNAYERCKRKYNKMRDNRLD